jgi:hypothetical protein
MSSTECLTNSTMCLVGLMALHQADLLLAKLCRFLRIAPRVPPVCAQVDCLYYAKKALKRHEAEEAVKRLRWPDGSPISRIVRVPHDQKEPHVPPRRPRSPAQAQPLVLLCAGRP